MYSWAKNKEENWVKTMFIIIIIYKRVHHPLILLTVVVKVK